MDFLSMFNEKIEQSLLANKEYQSLLTERKFEKDIYCDLAMQSEFRITVKPAFFDGFESVGEPEYEFSQKLFNRAMKHVQSWPQKKIKMMQKVQKTHFKSRKEKLLSDIEYFDNTYVYYTHAFERRKRYQEHVAKHGVYDFEKTDKKLREIEKSTAKRIVANLSATPEMAEFVEERILSGGTTTVSKDGRFDVLASEIINEKIKEIKNEENRAKIQTIKNKVLQDSKKVIELIEEDSEQQL